MFKLKRGIAIPDDRIDANIESFGFMAKGLLADADPRIVALGKECEDEVQRMKDYKANQDRKP